MFYYVQEGWTLDNLNLECQNRIPTGKTKQCYYGDEETQPSHNGDIRNEMDRVRKNILEELG